LVQAARFIEVVDDDATSSRRAHRLDVLHDGGPVDLELVGEVVDRLPVTCAQFLARGRRDAR
jgi:hypothetical protein